MSLPSYEQRCSVFDEDARRCDKPGEHYFIHHNGQDVLIRICPEHREASKAASNPGR